MSLLLLTTSIKTCDVRNRELYRHVTKEHTQKYALDTKHAMEGSVALVFSIDVNLQGTVLGAKAKLISLIKRSESPLFSSRKALLYYFHCCNRFRLLRLHSCYCYCKRKKTVSIRIVSWFQSGTEKSLEV